ncbi:hypothetical protein KGM_211327 [Danaus plexippus plexippus]|uniref:Uncharacterized protein n=1 Tax=Danaus plexippus plexippus TaxID=278856 RepID=A0A212FIL4_DANPL|nr:hypothetical protein KGM_211327 [Danaus plexippus plexippus]
MGARNDAARASANVFIHRPDTIIVGNQRCFCLDRDDRFEDFQPANVKGEVTVINGGISILAGHDISRSFTMKTTLPSPDPCRANPRDRAAQPPAPSAVHPCNNRDAQLNMDVIEKRVSGNERVYNWWAVVARSDPVALPGDPADRPATYHPPTEHPALNNLPESDTLTKSLLKEIDSAVLPEEICIALGATPVTCKEIYRILMPHACHKPQCHSNNIASDQKIQKSVFRNLVTSEKLSKVFFDSLAPTNMYVFIKKIPLNNQDVTEAFSEKPRDKNVIYPEVRMVSSFLTYYSCSVWSYYVIPS